jgi:Lanthionine synthetase C-like protein
VRSRSCAPVVLAARLGHLPVAGGRSAARAVAVATSAPVTWPQPGIAHGLAGDHNDGGLHWPITRREAAGYYGFADGVAGIGTFLLSAGQALGDHAAMRTAHACGLILCRAAVTIRGAAWWPMTEGGQDIPAGRWSSESPGVGSFLIRLWSYSGDSRFLNAAEQAATGIYRERWAYSPPALAGSGEFLLDMAAATGDDRYRAQAEDLAACVASRAALRHRYLIPPDDTLRDVHAGYINGLAGVLGFLLRVRHGGPRLWMADPPDGDHNGVPPVRDTVPELARRR